MGLAMLKKMQQQKQKTLNISKRATESITETWGFKAFISYPMVYFLNEKREQVTMTYFNNQQNSQC